MNEYILSLYCYGKLRPNQELHIRNDRASNSKDIILEIYDYDYKTYRSYRAFRRVPIEQLKLSTIDLIEYTINNMLEEIEKEYEKR